MIYIISVYFFTLLVRLLLSYTIYTNSFFNIAGHPLSIFTPDAALYGHYAQLLLASKPHLTDVHLLEYILYYLVKYTPFTLDQVILYLPAFLSSLVVVPVMLIMRLYSKSNLEVLFSGVLAGVGYGYYSRTYLGYCDTDILNIVLPMFILYSMLFIVKRERYNYILLTLLGNVFYIFWYHSSLVLVVTMNFLFILYLLVKSFKKAQSYKMALLVILSIVKIYFLYKTALFVILFVGLKYLKISYKYYIGFFLSVFILALTRINLSEFIINAQRYIFKTDELHIENFDFIAPMQLVSEATNIGIMELAHLVSGNIFLFILSLFGYILLTYKHREMLLALPMLLLGLLSFKAGVRFHIYAVPIMVIGYIYFIHFFIPKLQLKKYFSLFLFFVMLVPALYANYSSLVYWNTQVARPVFFPEQVKALQDLKERAKKGSYAVAWWDYGWPIWYYSDLDTMIDNGRHHADNYTVSNIFMSNSQRFSHNAIHYFYDTFAKKNRDAILQGLKKYKSISKLFAHIDAMQINKDETIDKYIILPIQMSKLLYTIYIYANIDPLTGKKLSNHIFRQYTIRKETKNFIYFNSNVKLDKSKSLLIQNKKSTFIKKFVQIAFFGTKKMKRVTDFSKDGLILVKLLNNYFVMDDYFYNSTLTQLLFLNKYDKRYFEPFYEGETISIYKVK